VRLVAERRDSQLGYLHARFFDATFVLTDDWLAFSATTAHPVDAVLLAGRRLARVDG